MGEGLGFSRSTPHTLCQSSKLSHHHKICLTTRETSGTRLVSKELQSFQNCCKGLWKFSKTYLVAPVWGGGPLPLSPSPPWDWGVGKGTGGGAGG